MVLWQRDAAKARAAVERALQIDVGTLQFYDGLPDLFMDLRATMEEHLISHRAIEFYMISGGLEEVIRGKLNRSIPQRNMGLPILKKKFHSIAQTLNLTLLNSGTGKNSRDDGESEFDIGVMSRPCQARVSQRRL